MWKTQSLRRENIRKCFGIRYSSRRSEAELIDQDFHHRMEEEVEVFDAKAGRISTYNLPVLVLVCCLLLVLKTSSASLPSAPLKESSRVEN
jgi:hypothetical protein